MFLFQCSLSFLSRWGNEGSEPYYSQNGFIPFLRLISSCHSFILITIHFPFPYFPLYTFTPFTGSSTVPAENLMLEEAWLWLISCSRRCILSSSSLCPSTILVFLSGRTGTTSFGMSQQASLDSGDGLMWYFRFLAWLDWLGWLLFMLAEMGSINSLMAEHFLNTRKCGNVHLKNYFHCRNKITSWNIVKNEIKYLRWPLHLVIRPYRMGPRQLFVCELATSVLQISKCYVSNK